MDKCYRNAEYSAVLVACSITGEINNFKTRFSLLFFSLPVTPEPISTTVTVHTTVYTSAADFKGSEVKCRLDNRETLYISLAFISGVLVTVLVFAVIHLSRKKCVLTTSISHFYPTFSRQAGAQAAKLHFAMSLWWVSQAMSKPHTLELLCHTALKPILHSVCNQCRQLSLVSLFSLECKRSHQTLQDQVPLPTVTEESAKNIQVKVATISIICKDFSFLIDILIERREKEFAFAGLEC
ncbi:uncharacterized protein AAGF69_013628 [Amazona ochrocephala]